MITLLPTYRQWIGVTKYRHIAENVIIILFLSLSWSAFALLAAQTQHKTQTKYCDNAGGPSPHNCMCQQATADSCDTKPEYNMPNCKTNCRPDACKCSPEKCS